MNRRETPRLGGRSAPWLLTRDDYAGRGSELRKEERVSETGGEAVKEGAIERRKSQHPKGTVSGRKNSRPTSRKRKALVGACSLEQQTGPVNGSCPGAFLGYSRRRVV